MSRMEGERVSAVPIYRGVIAVVERQHAVVDARNSRMQIWAGE